MRDYFDEVHRPARMTLRLEGDVPTDANQLGRLLSGVLPDDLFRGKASCDRTPTAEAVAVSAGELVTVRAPVPAPQVHVGWHVPVVFRPDDLWLDRFADVLATSMQRNVGFLLSERHRASWLESRCVVEQGARSGLLHCTFDLPAEEYGERASKALLRAIPNPVESDELANTYGAIGLHGEAALPDAMARWDSMRPEDATWRALYTHFGGVWKEGPYLSAVASVDVRAMTRRAMEVIGPKNVAVALLLPMEVTDPAPGGVAGETLPFSLTGAPAGASPRPDLGGVTSFELASGLPVWLDVRGREHITVAAARLGIPGGRFAEAAPGEARAWLQVQSWRNGYQASLLERRTGVTATRADRGRMWRVWARSTSANLKPLAWSLRHEIDVPFSAYEEQLLREGVERSIELRLGSRTTKEVPPYPGVIADDMRWAAVLPGHPAGVSWWDRYGPARTVSAGALRDHARRMMQPERGLLVVSSSEPLDIARPVLTKYLGKWRGLPDPDEEDLPPPPQAAAPESRQIVLYPRSGAVADVQLSCRLPGRTPVSRASLEVAAGVVRARLALDPALAGGSVEIVPVDARHAVLEVSFAADPGHVAAATRALLTVLSDASRGIEAPLLEVGRRDAALRHALSLSSADGRADALLGFAMDGYELPDVAAHAEALERVTARQASGTLVDCAGHEAISVIGPVGGAWFVGVDGVRVADWRSELEAIARGFD